MSQTMDFERLVADWLRTDGPADIRSEVVEAALASARRTGRRRGLVAALVGPASWPAYGRRIGFGTLPPAVRIAIALALMLALAAGAAVVGSRLLVPRPAPQSDVHEFVSRPDLSRPMARPLLSPLSDGRVLVIGGGSDSEDPTLTGIIYDPTTGVSEPVESLTGVPVGPVVQLRDGRVLIIGDGSANLFDPTTLRLEPAGPMATARSWPAAAVLQDGRVLIVGGSVPGGWPSSSTPTP